VGGAGGMTGSLRVSRAPPDGYQLVIGNLGSHGVNQTLYKRPLYNSMTDFAPVGLVNQGLFVLLVRKDFPASTLSEFTAYTKANAAKLQFGSGGAGSTTHMVCVLLNMALGLQTTTFPIVAPGPRCRIWSAAASTTSASRCRPRCRSFTATTSSQSRSWPASAPRSCRKFRPQRSRGSRTARF